ncbi:MAG TPA: aspartate aminotransferase [Cytophagales bacterium]|nr:aspartate aminotransferase [Cytophagales bacterium]
MEGNSISKNLNLNVRGLQPSATLAINEQSNALIAEGKQVYKLGLGQSPFPVPDRVAQALADNSHQKDYLPVKGLWELREAVAGHNLRYEEAPSRPQDVLIGPGSKELIFILQLVYYGDLIIPTPGWVSYSPQARIVGRHVHRVRTKAINQWKLMPEQLELLCRADPDHPRVVILNYPSNPTGCTYSEADLEHLAAVARKYKIVLISDEIYGLLHHEGKHKSIANFYPEGTIISSGLSKWCGAGGWRLGTFSFPENLHWLLDAMAIVASETYTATSAPIQYAAVSAFQGGEDIDHYLVQSRKVLKMLASFLTRRLQAMHLHVIPPDGAFYLYPDFNFYRDALAQRGIRTSVELCQAILRDTGIAMLPGFDFGQLPDELLVRMAYVDFEGADALQAIESFPWVEGNEEAFAKQHAPKLVSAMEVLQQWLNSIL